jgi:hypothetical protein
MSRGESNRYTKREDIADQKKEVAEGQLYKDKRKMR